MRTSPRTGLALAIALLLLAAAAPAHADDAQAAREHYQKGTSYYDLGRYAEAIREFEAAYEIKNDPALLYNLAQSHRLAGNSEQALHFYRTYLRRVPKAANRTEIEGRIAQLEQLVAQKNSAQTTPPNVTIPPGGTTPPPAGTEPPPPGNMATPPSNTVNPLSTAPPPPPPVDMAPAGTTAPPAGVVMTPPPAAPENPRARTFQRLGIIGGAVGGALVLVGLAEGIRAAAASNEVATAAHNGQVFDPAVEKRGKNFQKAEAIFLVSGVVVGGAGVVSYLYGRHLRQATATVTPVASADGAGAMLRVTF